MDIHDRASKLKQLRDDDMFVYLMQEVETRQVRVFKNPDSSSEEREAAHAVIRGLKSIEHVCNSLISEATVARKREDTGP